MAKNLKSQEVIELIQQKVTLKKQLRLARKDKNDTEVQRLCGAISSIEEHLSSTPLQKS
tara:strand:- start:2301 stop:2477 length:177 start_codon:yes stop_codon:yes gene_type:complete